MSHERSRDGHPCTCVACGRPSQNHSDLFFGLAKYEVCSYCVIRGFAVKGDTLYQTREIEVRKLSTSDEIDWRR